MKLYFGCVFLSVKMLQRIGVFYILHITLFPSLYTLHITYPWALSENGFGPQIAAILDSPNFPGNIFLSMSAEIRPRNPDPSSQLGSDSWDKTW